MASICSKVIILFILAYMSTLSSADEGWFRRHNCTSPFKPRHKHPRSPPPPSPPPSRHWSLPPPSQSPPHPPPSKRPRSPPSQSLPLPLAPPPRHILSPSPSRRPRTAPSRMVPPHPQSPLPSPSPSPSSPLSPSSTPQSPRKIVVGGSEHWHLGFDYNDWTLKNSPFYLNDILVFKYHPLHSVYLLPNMRSFNNCDLGKAKMVANLTQGSGDGFEFVLKKQNPYYFACGEGNGFHCKIGFMKFSITPIV